MMCYTRIRMLFSILIFSKLEVVSALSWQKITSLTHLSCLSWPGEINRMADHQNLDEAFRSLFETNMGMKPGDSTQDNREERVLVFSDTIRPDETPTASDHDRRIRLNVTARAAAGFAARVYDSGGFVEFPATPASGAEPPYELWLATFGDSTSAALESEGLLAKLLAKAASSDGSPVPARSSSRTGVMLPGSSSPSQTTPPAIPAIVRWPALPDAALPACRISIRICSTRRWP